MALRHYPNKQTSSPAIRLLELVLVKCIHDQMTLFRDGLRRQVFRLMSNSTRGKGR